MKILMDCLLFFLSGFVFWQFAVIREKGFWSCHLDFVPMVVVSGVVIGLIIFGWLNAFSKNKIPFRGRLVGILTLAVSLIVFFVEIIPAWFNRGYIYGYEPAKFILFGELIILGTIAIFGLINLVIDLINKNKDN